MVAMQRALASSIVRDIATKMVLIAGPRQVGKTTLAKMLTPDFVYLNYDHPEHRAAIHERSWDRHKPLVILDELHKMPNWKSWLKGIYDVEGIPPALVVTGSARLDASRRAGESMAGRFFCHRLHPFDVKEVAHEVPPAEALERILTVGGFPEPFLANDVQAYERWRKSHLDIIVRQDLVDLALVKQLAGVEHLITLLQRRVGSTIAVANLARDLGVDPKTVAHWLAILESLYVIFGVAPYTARVGRAILKARKYYFYDTGQVIGDRGAKLENAVACALLKECHRVEDQTGATRTLHYMRNKEGLEVDFVVTDGNRETHCIEVKSSDPEPTSALRTLTRHLNAKALRLQLVGTLDRERTYPDGVEVRAAAPWLAALTLG